MIAPPETARVLCLYGLARRAGGRPIGLVLVAASLHEMTTALRTLLTLIVDGMSGVWPSEYWATRTVTMWRHRPGGEGRAPDMAALTEGIAVRQRDRPRRCAHPAADVARPRCTCGAMLGRLHEVQALPRCVGHDAAREVRTPLATSRRRGGVHLLALALDARTREGFSTMRDEAARLARLVANLLLRARGDEERVIDRRSVELGVLLSEVARQARAGPGARCDRGYWTRRPGGSGGRHRPAQLPAAQPRRQRPRPPTRRWRRRVVSLRCRRPDLPCPGAIRALAACPRSASASSSASTAPAGRGTARPAWPARAAAHGGRSAVESTVGRGSTRTGAPALSKNPLTAP